MKASPPKWADRFLTWYCNPELMEEIQGDAYELYFRDLKNSGKPKADWHFVWNVIRFFRWCNIRKNKKTRHSSISIDMLKSYFITGYRSIVRNLVPSSINIIGLSIALGCAVTIFILLDSYYDLDTMHKKGDRIYLVTNMVKGASEPEHWANSPYLLGPALKADNTAVETVVRIEQIGGVAIRYHDIVFNERVWFTDPDFMGIFNFPLKYGNKNALSDKSQVIITQAMAEKYFGKEDPLGKILSFRFTESQREDFTVGAVMENISDNSSMAFRFLISTEKLNDLKLVATDSWKTFANANFVLMKPGHGPEELNATLTRYQKDQNESNITWPIQHFELIALHDVAQRSYNLVNSLSWSNHPVAMIAMAVIAIFLVLLACFNYMNVAVASVSTRLKEIGIRKVTGSSKKNIISQFLVENLLLCALAMIVGTMMSYFFLVPGLNSLFTVHIPFTFSSAWTLLLFFGGLLTFVAGVSGAYPAFYVSSFNAVSILKGKEKFGNKSRLSKILLSLQFILAFTTIIACLMFASASYYFESLDWGYSHAQTIVVPVRTKEQFLALKDRVSQNKNIVKYAGTQSQIGRQGKVATITVGGEAINLTGFAVDFDYMETMGLRLKEGRFFDPLISSDKVESVVVNESFVKKMNWKLPLNQSFILDSIKRYVIGVVRNFHHSDFYEKMEPMVFNIGAEENFKYVAVTAEPGSILACSDFLKKNWKEIAPDDPYQGFFQDEVFASMFESNRSSNKILYFISSVALLLSCMGLYGLISYNLTRRLKEFSVRKVFGASMLSIFQLMNKDYLWIVLFAFAIGAPLGFYLMDKMLFSIYPYPIPTSLWPFLVTIGLMVATVAITISTQLRRVANENPTETLRSE